MVTTAVEKIDDTKVKLTITVEADRVTKAIDAAAQRLAGQMKVPGFRPGKAPVRVIESRLGKGAVQEEAARESLPTFYSEALQGLEDITVVGPPSFEVDEFSRGVEGSFTATVDVRPDVEVPEYEGLTIEHPEWELTEEELADNLESLRERFAEVETVERPAQQGDYVTITLTAKDADGEVVDEASAEDMLYRIPTEDTDSELDKALQGAEAGAILTFTDALGPDYGDPLAGKELSFTAIVKEVKVQQLPELDDDFALTASEFDTIEELKEDLRTQIGREKRQMAVANLRGKVVETIAEMVEVPLPQSLVEEEQRFRLNRLAHQAEHNGIPFDQFLTMASGGDPQQLIDMITSESENTVRAQLVVDEIGQAAGISVDQQDLSQEVARQAARLGRDPNEIAQLMLQPDRIGALYADAYRRKTIDHIMSVVEITGAPPEELEDEDVDVIPPDAQASADSASSSSSPSSASSDESDDSADEDDEAETEDDEADDDEAEDATDEDATDEEE